MRFEERGMSSSSGDRGGNGFVSEACLRLIVDFILYWHRMNIRSIVIYTVPSFIFFIYTWSFCCTSVEYSLYPKLY